MATKKAAKSKAKPRKRSRTKTQDKATADAPLRTPVRQKDAPPTSTFILEDQPFHPGEEVGFHPLEHAGFTDVVHATVREDRTIHLNLMPGEWVAHGPAGSGSGVRDFRFTVK